MFCSDSINDQATKMCGSFFGDAFHLLRLRKKFTQVQVAERLGEALGESVTQSFVSKIENGEKCVSLARFGYYC